MPILYVVTGGAPSPAGPVPALVAMAQTDGWTVLVVSTPLGRRFLDPERLHELTGEPVRSDFGMPGEGGEPPRADAVIAAPATFTTVNKWAAGIADNFAVSLLCELTGSGVPIVAVPAVKPALARHPAFRRSLDVLEQLGVRVMSDEPSWEVVLDELRCGVLG